MNIAEIRRDFRLCTTKVKAGSPSQKACVTRDTLSRFSGDVYGTLWIRAIKDGKVVLRKRLT